MAEHIQQNNVVEYIYDLTNSIFNDTSDDDTIDDGVNFKEINLVSNIKNL